MRGPTTTKTIRSPRNGCETSSPLVSSQAEKSMSGQSSMCEPMISEASRNAISSQELAVGHTPSDSLDGPTTDLFGQEVVPVSRSLKPESAKASLTTGTFGRLGFGSLASDDLQQSLESRLRAQLNGSDLCEVIWKPWATPWGQRRSRPRAQVRSTCETDFGSWRTPNARFKGGGEYTDPVKALQRLDSGHQINLSEQVLTSTWLTPSASEDAAGTVNGKMQNMLTHQAKGSVWPTPQARDHFPAHSKDYIAAKKAEGHGMANLNDVAQHALYPTPNSNVMAGDPEKILARQKIQKAKWGNNGFGLNIHQFAAIEASNGQQAQTENSGQLNPEFVFWLMGFPTAFLNCAPSETPSILARQRNSSSQQPRP